MNHVADKVAFITGGASALQSIPSPAKHPVS